jgi:hypothetical protein
MAGARTEVTKDVPSFAVMIGNSVIQDDWFIKAGQHLNFGENNIVFFELQVKKLSYNGGS